MRAPTAAPQDRALHLVRAARRQLQTLRVLRGASRGALFAAALGLLWILIAKLPVAGVTLASMGPIAPAWWMTLAGALAGAALTLGRTAIPATVAALYLDQRCSTEERFVTLWSLPDDAHAPEWARAVADVARIPRLPLPREVGLLPVALFLLFGASLLPSAEAESPVKIARVVDGNPESAAANSPAAEIEPGAGIDAAAKTLRRSVALDAGEMERLERAIDAAFALPEQRAEARLLLSRARAGDRSAQDRLAKALLDGAGALAKTDARSGAEGAPRAPHDAERAASSPYQDEVAFLRAYDVEVARLTRRGKG